jgi:hypothetical protein
MPPTTSAVLSVDRNVLDQDYPFLTESEANPEDYPTSDTKNVAVVPRFLPARNNANTTSDSIGE